MTSTATITLEIDGCEFDCDAHGSVSPDGVEDVKVTCEGNDLTSKLSPAQRDLVVMALWAAAIEKADEAYADAVERRAEAARD